MASRERSAAIFGNRSFADVVMTLDRLTGQGDVVTTRKVASETAISDSVVRSVMLRLSAGGLITAQERVGGTRGTQPFQVHRGRLWASLVEACLATTETGQDTGTPA